MGLGPEASSTPGQLSALGTVPFAFAFCLDGTVENGSFFIMGPGPARDDLDSTPFLMGFPTSSRNYFVNVTQILVGDKVAEGSVDLGKKGVIVDSGTQLTALPKGAYDGMLSEVSTPIHTVVSCDSLCILKSLSSR